MATALTGAVAAAVVHVIYAATLFGDLFAQRAAGAVKLVKMTQNGKEMYPLAAIHIFKAHGKSSTDSQLLKAGFAIQAVRAAQGMPTQLEG